MLIKFYGNKVGADFIVVRADGYADGTRLDDVLGKGTRLVEAPDSERARSMVAAHRSRQEAQAQRDAAWASSEAA